MKTPQDSALVVLFLWDVPGAVRARLQTGAGGMARLIFPEAGSRDAVLEAAPQAHVLVGWRPDEELLKAASKLRFWINPGAGVQHVAPPLRLLNEGRSVPVRLINGHGNSYATAQGAVALLLALSNQIVRHHQWLADGAWRKGDADAPSVHLRGRTVGLLGYGAVNRWVHTMLSGFDLRFAALRTSWTSEERERGPGEAQIDPATPLSRFTPVQLADFLDTVDVLVTALPLTDRTQGMLGARELARLGPHGLLVHTARGPIVDEAALYAALADGTIGGAAIDVWWNYKPDSDDAGRAFPFDAVAHPFHALRNVVLSPHRAASPFGDLERWDEVVENIRRIAADRTPLNLVDLERGY